MGFGVANENAIIIKRVKKDDHGAAHGGAWKVAYADFVTAMMAFFLLMWLINTTTPEQKRGIADYFAAQSISQTYSGSGGVLGGRVLSEESARAGAAVSVFQKSSPPAPNDTTRAQQQAHRTGGATNAIGIAPASQEESSDHLERAVPSIKDGAFESAAESIRQAMQDNPEIAALSKQVIMDETPEGLRIQLIDQDGRPMFDAGSNHPTPRATALLNAIAKVITRLPNRISISGHTDGKPFQGGHGMTNWELSAERANAARAILAQAGLGSDRIYQVAGKAGSEPLLPEDPDASANRRLSIVLMREVPPAPPGHSL
ncbi:MAG: OmpA family protein [Alphaproteobacteria bacterium]|jgi:chemotaxis protein MotB|nr:OmpA family protein [Alphaproteobacteria bacterium]MBN9570999.1 OmpA family protein [Alphaproteobacteria bacterium]MBN9579636.1 OmpA family protein [Alphaproteobacteria bacterium]OJU55997.1 MAG: chemotaxis protein MotB [Alphaproteobacteria bacterium 62-8]